MEWLIVVACLMFLYGSFVMVRPSPRQKKIAALRQKAIEMHLEVRLASRLKLPEELSRADMVCLILTRAEGEEGQKGSCFRNLSTRRIRCHGVFSGKESDTENIFADLPQGVEALISGQTYVGLCWDERGDDKSIEMIVAELPKISRLTMNLC